MKILQVSQKLFQLAGFFPFESTHSTLITVILNVTLFGVSTFSITSMGYVVYTADNFYDLSDLLAIFTVAISFFCSYLALLRKRRETIQIIKELEETVNERIQISSPLQTIYERNNSILEDLSVKFISIAYACSCFIILHRTITSAYIFIFRCDEDDARNSLRLIMAMA